MINWLDADRQRLFLTFSVESMTGYWIVNIMSYSAFKTTIVELYPNLGWQGLGPCCRRLWPCCKGRWWDWWDVLKAWRRASSFLGSHSFGIVYLVDVFFFCLLHTRQVLIPSFQRSSCISFGTSWKVIPWNGIMYMSKWDDENLSNSRWDSDLPQDLFRVKFKTAPRLWYGTVKKFITKTCI